MSDTFKYLDNKDANAQNFLQGKMKTVANASEGVIPGGDAYKKYGKMPGTDSDSDSKSSTPTSTGSDAYKDFDVNEKYKSGQWGSGKLSQQDLADQYGLDTSAAKAEVVNAAKTCSIDVLTGASGYDTTDFPLVTGTCAADKNSLVLLNLQQKQHSK